MASSSGTNSEKRKASEEKSSDDHDRSISPPPSKKLAICLKTKPSASGPNSATNSASPNQKLTVGGSSGSSSTEKKPTVSTVKTVASVKAVFGEDDDSDEAEEMPAECKMRMRNVGRETPTSAGPNSFRKGKHGFVDGRKLAERHIQDLIVQVSEERPK